MAKIEVTVADADLAAVNAAWVANGYADFAARLQAFADEEAKAARVLAAATAVAAEQAKGGAASAATLKDLLYAEYQARV